jgi:hypothetical protein
MNLEEAARLLGRDYYVDPSGKKRFFPPSPKATGFDYIRAGWIAIVGGTGLGYILVALAQLIGVIPNPFGYLGFFVYLIVGSIIGKIGTLPVIKNEPLKAVSSIGALIVAAFMVYTNVWMYG